MTGAKIRVLIVEDSPVSRELLAHILRSDAAIEIAGFAWDGEEALAAVESLRPDVVTMDIHMPKLDGFATTRRIMERHPVPILIVTASANPGDVRQAFEVIDAGAVGLLEKPPGHGHPQHELYAARLIQNVKLMSEVRVIRRWTRPRISAGAPGPDSKLPAPPASCEGSCEVIAIGASTGGPPVLHTLLHGIRQGLTVPVLVVQHIASGFIGGLADWLAQTTGLPVQVATHGLQALPGHVYLAPDHHHLIARTRGRLVLSSEDPEGGLRPSVAQLFRSVGEAFGPRAIGVILTGMGNDGAAELKFMRDRGAVTFAQNAETSVIFGMPGEAIRLGAAEHILPPDRIASTIAAMLNSAPAS